MASGGFGFLLKTFEVTPAMDMGMGELRHNFVLQSEQESEDEME